MPASKLISLDVAIRNIKSNFKKISNEDVFLQNSLGRCLANPFIVKLIIQNMMFLLWTAML